MKNSEEEAHLQVQNPIPKEDPSFTSEISFKTHILSGYSLFLSLEWASQVGKKEGRELEFCRMKPERTQPPKHIYRVEKLELGSNQNATLLPILVNQEV